MGLRADDPPFQTHGFSIYPSMIPKGLLERSNRYRPELILITRIQYANERYFSLLLRLSEHGLQHQRGSENAEELPPLHSVDPMEA